MYFFGIESGDRRRDSRQPRGDHIAEQVERSVKNRFPESRSSWRLSASLPRLTGCFVQPYSVDYGGQRRWRGVYAVQESIPKFAHIAPDFPANASGCPYPSQVVTTEKKPTASHRCLATEPVPPNGTPAADLLARCSERVSTYCCWIAFAVR